MLHSGPATKDGWGAKSYACAAMNLGDSSKVCAPAGMQPGCEGWNCGDPDRHKGGRCQQRALAGAFLARMVWSWSGPCCFIAESKRGDPVEFI